MVLHNKEITKYYNNKTKYEYISLNSGPWMQNKSEFMYIILWNENLRAIVSMNMVMLFI